MPHPDKIDKLESILKAIKNQLAKSPAIALAQTFRDHKLPAEYGPIMLSFGIIHKMDGGKRGPTSYKWNKKFLPDHATANNIILAYNKIRTKQSNLRETDNPYETNKDILMRLHDMLGTVSAKLDRIENKLLL